VSEKVRFARPCCLRPGIGLVLIRWPAIKVAIEESANKVGVVRTAA
jgi:hypothetical protein